MPRPPRVEPGFRVLSSDGPLWANDPDGSYWGRGRVLVKPSAGEEPRAVAFEFLASRLMAALGLPTPAGEVAAELQGRTSWVSTVVDLDGEDVAPPDASHLVERYPDLAAGMFVFDVWTLNCDRHEENFVAHDRLGLWAIDHEHAFAALRNSDPMQAVGDVLTYHAFRDLDLDEAKLHVWGERVRGLPRSNISRMVLEAYERRLYRAPLRDAIQAFLLQRRTDIHTLVSRSRPVRQPPDGRGSPPDAEGRRP